jgi:hypothetical protein
MQKKHNTPAYKLVVDSTPENRNDKWIKTAIYSVINAVRETNDYSNGATHWDGPDVMTGNYPGYDAMKHYRQQPLNGTEYRVQGIYDPKDLSKTFHEKAKLYYTKFDMQRAPYLKGLFRYSKSEHYDIVAIDPKDKNMKLNTGDPKKDSSYNKEDTILEGGVGTGLFLVVIKCLWEVKAQRACSIFYKQLNIKY